MNSGREGNAQASVQGVLRLEPEEGIGNGVVGKPVTDTNSTWLTQDAGPQSQ